MSLGPDLQTPSWSRTYHANFNIRWTLLVTRPCISPHVTARLIAKFCYDRTLVRTVTGPAKLIYTY